MHAVYDEQLRAADKQQITYTDFVASGPGFLGNKAMVEPLLSRLRHYCHTVRIEGPSLRVACWRPTARRQALVARFAHRTVPAHCVCLSGAYCWTWSRNAMILACLRRLVRPADAPPLGVIRSLAYLSPVIDEVLGLRVDDAYFLHLRQRLSGLARRS